MSKDCARERPAFASGMSRSKAEQQAPVWRNHQQAGRTQPSYVIAERAPCNAGSSAWAISGLQRRRAQQSVYASASNLYACQGVVR